MWKGAMGHMKRANWDPDDPKGRPFRESTIHTASFEEFVEKSRDICNIINVWIGHDQHLPLYADISEIGPFELSAADEDHVYIMAKDATKGLAVEILAGLYGVKAENVMAFGDSKNDASMLRWAGLGVAMGNANQLDVYKRQPIPCWSASRAPLLPAAPMGGPITSSWASRRSTARSSSRVKPSRWRMLWATPPMAGSGNRREPLKTACPPMPSAAASARCLPPSLRCV